MVILAIIFFGIASVINAYNDDFRANYGLELIQGSHGEVIQRASITGFEKELEDAANEQKKEAGDYFNAAETDFKSWRYLEATNNYQKSINALPTMSAYLNLGLALLYVSDFQRAKDAFASGLAIAQKKENKLFEGAFIGNIGLVYINQGNLGKASDYSTTALEIYRKMGYPEGQATALNVIGNIYLEQGKLGTILKSSDLLIFPIEN